jgi:hypothetical protein
MCVYAYNRAKDVKGEIFEIVKDILEDKRPDMAKLTFVWCELIHKYDLPTTKSKRFSNV